MTALRGTYALLLHLAADSQIAVGRLGVFSFPAGYYIYVGSALGSGGLPARLARHRRTEKRRHWHIDYILAQARIVDLATDGSGRRLECAWVQTLLRQPSVWVVAPHLGASDCGCPSHLLYYGDSAAGWRNGLF